MNPHTTACTQKIMQETYWYEYPAETLKPTTAYTQQDITSIQAQLTAGDITPQDANDQFTEIQKAMLLEEKYDNAWHSKDQAKYLISAHVGMESDLTQGFTRYSFDDGKALLNDSGLYDPMVRGE